MDEFAQSHADYSLLYREHLGAISQYVARRCPGHDAGDIVAETFSTAWRRFADIPAPPMQRPWLYGVARRVLSNYRRGQNRRSALGERLCSEWSSKQVINDAHQSNLEIQALRDAVSRLSASDSELLLLSAWEELTPAEISVVLELGSDVVRNRLSRARRRLREELKAQEIQKSPGGHQLDNAPVDSGEGEPRG